MAGYLVRRGIKQRKATIDAELQGLWQRIYRVEARQDQDWRKQERYCREQREVLLMLQLVAVVDQGDRGKVEIWREACSSRSYQ